MSWKGVLRPTKAKIALFLIIFVIFVPLVEYDTGIRCIRAPCPAGATGPILISLFSHGLFGLNYVVMVPGLIISYLASCGIALLYSRIRKK